MLTMVSEFVIGQIQTTPHKKLRQQKKSRAREKSRARGKKSVRQNEKRMHPQYDAVRTRVWHLQGSVGSAFY